MIAQNFKIMSYITDFHTHIALKAANNEHIKDVWTYEKNNPPQRYLFFFNALRRLALDSIYRKFATETQCDLGNCVDGKMRIVGCALYPIERQYIARRNKFIWLLSALSFFRKKFPFIQLFNKKRDLLTTMVQVVVGTSEKRARAIWDEQKRYRREIDYFQDYLKEFNHLMEVHNKPSSNPKYHKNTFRIARNYDDLEENLKNPDIISGIISLEGIHGLGTYTVKQLFKANSIESLKSNERSQFLKTLFDNIERVKKDEWLCPFYITMAHHYNNLLIGHVKSFVGMMTLVFKQKKGLNKGITKEGEQVIDLLLARNKNMKRILIDIKHMSVDARKRYYEILDVKQQGADENELGIPIISSHSAVSGIKTLEIAKNLGCSKKEDKTSYVSRCDVNLCNEDILKIHNSKGLIGVLMHDGRMPGKTYWKAFKAVEKNAKKRKLLQQQMFLTNVYHIIAVVHKVNNEDGWPMITLGSDMDGLIDPFDDYDTAEDLDNFRNDIYSYLEHYKNIQPGYKIKNLFDAQDGSVEYTPSEIETLNKGRSATQIVNGIFHENHNTFLKIYFSKEYLNGIGDNPPIV